MMKLASRTSREVPIPILLLLVGTITQAAAQGKQPGIQNLFGPGAVDAPASDMVGMRPETIGTVSHFALSIDPNGIARGRSPLQQRMEITLPGGKSVSCLLRPETRADGLTVLTSAPSREGAGERCDLAIENGQVTGDIDTASGRFRIQPVGSGTTHAVIEVRTEAFPNESSPNEAESPQPAEPDDQRFDRGSAGVIAEGAPLCDVKGRPGEDPKQFGPLRVMLLYTPAARKSSQNIRADIELIITQIRRAFSASALGGNFSLLVQLVHSGEVNYVEPPPPDGTMAKDLDLLTGKTDPDNPVFKQIRALRDERRAHVVHMLINKRPNDGCGIGWGPAAQMRAVAINRTFSVSDRQCALGNFSAVHEIGHNLGLHHDRYVVPKAKVGPEEFNYGFINMQEGVRSLMAYTDQCTAEKKSCRRMLQLSSPNIRIGGTPFGRPIKDATAANNVEVLCRSAPMATKLR